jgi:hypothetical protein
VVDVALAAGAGGHLDLGGQGVEEARDQFGAFQDVEPGLAFP